MLSRREVVLGVVVAAIGVGGCGGDDEAGPGTGDPLADALAEQLFIQERGEGGFSVRDRCVVDF